MAKVIIPKEDLGDININTEEYQVRYRIITDDQNLSSYWSPTYSINPQFYFVPGSIYSTGSVKFSELKDAGSGGGTTTHAISVSWDTASIRKSISDPAVASSYLKLNITSATYSSSGGGQMTYTVNNSLVAGQTVSVYGCSNPGFNFEEGVVESATASNFVFDPATTILTNGASSSFGTVIGKSSLVGELEEYDIWIRWAQTGPINYSPWTYRERVSGSSTTINIPNSYIDTIGTIRLVPDILEIEIYRPGNPITRENNTDFLLYSAQYSF